ncbi:MAG: ABC transporter permease [Deltaproteobacteria bacterium]|nr:ABC transporter permease [Deltaproteobacteria bacterium]
MGFLADSFASAFRLIATFHPDVVSAARTSLVVSAWAIVFASLLGLPLGLAIGLSEFPLKRFAVTVLNSLVALPTVVVGLVVYGVISRQGPLGFLGLLFTPAAMVIGGSLLAAPIVANYALAAARGADPRILPTARTLGAGPVQAVVKFVAETRFGILAAVIAGFGRVISEVGVAMMLGGNIRGFTRTMTTAIALQTSMGEFAFGMALGIILMSVAFVINVFLGVLQQR